MSVAFTVTQESGKPLSVTFADKTDAIPMSVEDVSSAIVNGHSEIPEETLLRALGTIQMIQTAHLKPSA